MDIELSEVDGVTTCRPVGELDAFTVGDFREHLAAVAGTGGLVVDLSDVPFMDSAGLGALIGGIRRIRDAGSDVAVVCDRPAVLRLLHTTRFDRMVTVVSRHSEALSYLSEGPGAAR